MGPLIYSLCALTCLSCAVLLLRGYLQTKVHLLMWSGLCFIGLTASNIFLVLDRVIYPDVDLSAPRLWLALIGLALLVFGLVWERD
jgi:hypothetical protein